MDYFFHEQRLRVWPFRVAHFLCFLSVHQECSSSSRRKQTISMLGIEIHDAFINTQCSERNRNKNPSRSTTQSPVRNLRVSLWCTCRNNGQSGVRKCVSIGRIMHDFHATQNRSMGRTYFLVEHPVPLVDVCNVSVVVVPLPREPLLLVHAGGNMSTKKTSNSKWK